MITLVNLNIRLKFKGQNGIIQYQIRFCTKLKYVYAYTLMLRKKIVVTKRNIVTKKKKILLRKEYWLLRKEICCEKVIYCYEKNVTKKKLGL